jgi:hypothetical protein
MCLLASSRKTVVLSPMIHQLLPLARRQTWITGEGHVFVCFGSWRPKPVVCWIRWSLEGITILWTLQVCQCFCGINSSHLQGKSVKKWPFYLEEEGSIFQRNTGMYRYLYIVIAEHRSQQYLTSKSYIVVSFAKVPYFFGDLLPNQVSQLSLYPEVCVSRISHVHNEATLVLYSVVQWQKLGLSVTSRLENLSNS